MHAVGSKIDSCTSPKRYLNSHSQARVPNLHFQNQKKLSLRVKSILQLPKSQIWTPPNLQPWNPVHKPFEQPNLFASRPGIWPKRTNPKRNRPPNLNPLQVHLSAPNLNLQIAKTDPGPIWTLCVLFWGSPFLSVWQLICLQLETCLSHLFWLPSKMKINTEMMEVSLFFRMEKT